MATNKQGITSTEISRKLALRQKTCWSVKQKEMKAMASSKQFPLSGMVEVYETFIGQQEKGTKGRQNSDKSLLL
jgi:hypothetical protein